MASNGRPLPPRPDAAADATGVQLAQQIATMKVTGVSSQEEAAEEAELRAFAERHSLPQKLLGVLVEEHLTVPVLVSMEDAHLEQVPGLKFGSKIALKQAVAAERALAAGGGDDPEVLGGAAEVDTADPEGGAAAAPAEKEQQLQPSTSPPPPPQQLAREPSLEDDVSAVRADDAAEAARNLGYHKGWLLKRGASGLFKSAEYKRRYCVLQNGVLTYYSCEPGIQGYNLANASDSAANGHINVAQMGQVVAGKIDGEFLIQPKGRGRTFYFKSIYSDNSQTNRIAAKNTAGKHHGYASHGGRAGHHHDDWLGRLAAINDSITETRGTKDRDDWMAHIAAAIKG